MRKLKLIVATIFFSTGCSLLSPQATVIPYDPGVGFGVNVTKGLQIRGIFVVAQDSAKGNLIMTVFSEESHQLTVTVYDTGFSKEFAVEPGRSVFGPKKQIILENLGANPGQLLELEFSSGNVSKKVKVPILTNDLPEFADLLPPGVTANSEPGTDSPTEKSHGGADSVSSPSSKAHSGNH